MGIYDREYYRDETERDRDGGSWSAVGTIIVLNIAVYLGVAVFGGGWDSGFAKRWFALPGDLFRPDQALALITEGRIVTLITYGFAHSGDNLLHILFNMLMLWMFGSDIEGIYGKRLFWKMYLSFIILSGVCWVVAESFFLRRFWMTPMGELPPHAVGASGAVAGVMMLYVLHFPHRTILFFGVLPIPVWLWGTIWLGQEYLNFQLQVHGRQVTQIAHAAHLGGALFGWLFYRTHFTLFSLLPTHWLGKLRRSPRQQMRVVHPDDAPVEESLDAEVDRILAKISEHGTESLTAAEIHILEAASRRAQRRRGARHD
jgi:membrane associated rhomboid family serine protease